MAESVRLVCTDRGQHPSRLLGVVEVSGPPADAVKSERDEAPPAPDVVLSYGRKGAIYQARCRTCGRDVRLAYRRLVAFAAASPAALLDVSRVPT